MEKNHQVFQKGGLIRIRTDDISSPHTPGFMVARTLKSYSPASRLV